MSHCYARYRSEEISPETQVQWFCLWQHWRWSNPLWLLQLPLFGNFKWWHGSTHPNGTHHHLLFCLPRIHGDYPLSLWWMWRRVLSGSHFCNARLQHAQGRFQVLPLQREHSWLWRIRGNSLGDVLNSMHWQPKLPMQIILVVVCSFCLSTITLFSFMRWLCKSPFVFGKSYGVVRRNKLLIDWRQKSTFPSWLAALAFLKSSVVTPFCFRVPPMTSLHQQIAWLVQIFRYQSNPLIKKQNEQFWTWSNLGFERGGARASEGGVEGGAEKDGGGDFDFEAGSHCQGAARSWQVLNWKMSTEFYQNF